MEGRIGARTMEQNGGEDGQRRAEQEGAAIHAGLVAASACDLGPNSAGARSSKMAFSGVEGERAQELAGWRRRGANRRAESDAIQVSI